MNFFFHLIVLGFDETFECIRTQSKLFLSDESLETISTKPKRIIYRILNTSTLMVSSFFIKNYSNSGHFSSRFTLLFFRIFFFFVVSVLKLIQIGKVKNLSLIHLCLFILTRRSFAIFPFSILISVHFFFISIALFLLYFYSLNFFLFN